MKPYIEGFKKLKYNLKPSNINKTLEEVFVNLTFCHNCGTWNYTCSRISEENAEGDAYMFCKKCGHVHEVENQMIWH
jgi:transcription elongation factor Elf1